MSLRNQFVLVFAATLGVLLGPAIAAAKSEKKIVEDSTEVLAEFLNLKVKGIPAALLAEAHGVAIIPNLLKVGLVVGGQHGKGVVIVREKDGAWRSPSFIALTGGSIGWQVGAQATDIVLVFKTEKSVQGLLKGKFTIGADAAAAAGPVGRRLEAATDEQLRAEIYSYSRSRGLFAGVSINGSALQIDHEATAAYYGDNAEPPKAAWQLVEMVSQAIAAAGEGLPKNELLPNPDSGPNPVVGPTLADPTTLPAQPAVEAATLKSELAQAATQMNALIDDRWRRFLALPSEVFRDGQAPAIEALKATVARYNSIATDPQYRALAERPEFQATHDLLRAYLDALATGAAPKLALPPPPALEAR